MKKLIVFLIGVFILGACSRYQTGSYDAADNASPIDADLQSVNSDSLLDNIDPATILHNPSFKFERLTVAGAVSQSVIHSGFQDVYGFLWFGTNDGLNRYDGNEYTIFRNSPEDPYSLNNNNILSMLEDRDSKTIWVGTEHGINRLDMVTGRAKAYTHQSGDLAGLSNNVINVIYRDRAGQLWIGTEAGLNSFDEMEEVFRVYSSPPGNLSPDESLMVNAIVEDAEGFLWIGTNRGLMRFGLTNETFVEIPKKLKPYFISERLTVLSLLIDSGGNLWIGTIGGLLSLSADGQEVRYFQHSDGQPQSLSSDWINMVFEDRLGLIWVGTDMGLELFDPSLNGFHHFMPDPDKAGSISDAKINAIFQDDSGLLWFLTENGINKLDLSVRQFEHILYIPSEGRTTGTEYIYDIQQDADGNLWFGTNNGLIKVNPERTEYARYINYPSDEASLSHNVVVALELDKEQRLWIGTAWGGIDIYYPPQDGFIHLSRDRLDENQLSSRLISVMYQDHSGNIWIGYTNGRLDAFDRDQTRVTRYILTIEEPELQRRNQVRALVEDHLGMIWAGTAYGLYIINPTSGSSSRIFSTPNDPGSLSDNDVTALYEDQSGTLWVGTNGGGLNRYNRSAGTFTNYRIKDGMPNDSVYGILEDDYGRLWISTNLGITCFDPRTGVFRSFDEQDGLQSSAFNENSFYQSPSGEMFFGGINGITAFYPDRIADNPFVPNVMLTSLRQGDRVFNPIEAIEDSRDILIRWPDNYFEFEFAVLNYRQSSKNLFAYRLEGFESDWNTTGTRRYGRYTNLPGGDYKLHLIGSNDDGVWNTVGSTINIRVIPPIWENKTFQAVGIILILVSIVTGYLMKVRSVNERNRKLAALIEERTHEIEQRRQVAEGLRGVFILLNSNRPLDESLGFIQKQVLRLARARFAWIFQLSTAGSGSKVRVLAPQKQEQPAYLRQEVIDWFAARVCRKQSRLVSDWSTLVKSAPQLDLLDLKWIQTVVCVPIIPEREVFGGLVAFFDEVKQFSEEEVNLFNSFAEQASLAVGNQWLRTKAEEIAVVTERTRLARDLHDAVTQTLFSASLIAEALPRMWDNNPEEGRKLLDELRQLNRGALAEMRSLLMELRPAAVVEAQLPELIRQLAESASGRTAMAIKIDHLDECHLPDDVHLGFYRIAQEALANVVKHACAKHVQCSLRCDALNDKNEYDSHLVRVTLEIQDDGCGFDPDEVPTDRFGLVNIRERAKAIGAEISIESIPLKGTRIRLSWEGEEILDD